MMTARQLSLGSLSMLTALLAQSAHAQPTRPPPAATERQATHATPPPEGEGTAPAADTDASDAEQGAPAQPPGGTVEAPTASATESDAQATQQSQIGDPGQAPEDTSIEDSNKTMASEADAEQGQAEPRKPTSLPPLISGGPSDQSRSIDSQRDEANDDAGTQPGSPLRTPLSVELTIDNQWDTSAAHDYFDDDDVSTRVGIAVSYEVLELPARFFLAPQLGAHFGSNEEDSPPFGEAIRSTKLSRDTYYGGLILRHHHLGWLASHARIAAGATRLDMTLQPAGANSEAFNDDAWVFHGSLGGGVQVHTSPNALKGARFSLGALAEGGFSLESKTKLSLNGPAAPSGAGAGATELGELQRRGAYLRVSLLGRF